MMSAANAHLIVLEGLDATGKSTIAEALTAALGAAQLSTPPSALREVRQSIDQLYRSSGLAAQLFYASTVAFISEQARELLAAGRHVVVDRYWLSTLAYDALRPGSVNLACLESRLLGATLTVLLDTKDEERQHRLARRGATEADLQSLGEAGALRARFEALKQHPLAGKLLHLDTTSLDTQRCVDRILMELA